MFELIIRTNYRQFWTDIQKRAVTTDIATVCSIIFEEYLNRIYIFLFILMLMSAGAV